MASESNDALLMRFRRLCEAVGLARGHGVRLAPEAAEELTRIEDELRARLNDVSSAGSAFDRLSVPGGSRPGDSPDESSADEPTRRRDPDTGGDAGEPDTRSAVAPTNGSPTGLSPGALPANGARSGGPGQPVAATIFCDGACQGNPGPGGYGVIVRCAGLPDRELSGGKPVTTNNQMELAGAIAGLEAALECNATDITVITDSEYLVKGMTEWATGWQRKGWRTTAGTPVKNRDLWERLLALTTGRTMRWQWTKGHAGHPENERCDHLAVTAAQLSRLAKV